jgi:uncharacterized membrane protein
MECIFVSSFCCDIHSEHVSSVIVYAFLVVAIVACPLHDARIAQRQQTRQSSISLSDDIRVLAGFSFVRVWPWLARLVLFGCQRWSLWDCLGYKCYPGYMLLIIS